MPFQAPLQPIAGFNPDQLQSFQQVRNMQGMTNPYFAAATNYMNQSASPITGQDVAQYYNPMASNVFAQMGNIFGQQRAATTGNLTQQAGGVGADRIAVGQGELANQQGLAAGQTAAGLYGQALTAAQQNKQMQAGAGYGIGQLGGAAQAASLQATGALGQSGGLQQQLSQAQLNAPYQQQLQQIAFPYQQAQYLAGVTGSLAPAMGGTTNSQTTYPTPSPLSQVLGLGTAAMGLGGMGGMFGGGKGSTVPSVPYYGGTGLSMYGPPSGLYKRGGSVPRIPRKADGGASFPGVAPEISYIPTVSSQGDGGGHSGLLTGGMRDLPMPKGMTPQNQFASEVKAATGFAHALNHAADWGEGLSAGGAVNPYDVLKGYADGGDIYNENDYSPLDAKADVGPIYNQQDYSPLDARADVGRVYAPNEFSPIDAMAHPPDYPTKDEFVRGLQDMYGGMNAGVQPAEAAVPPAAAPVNPFTPPPPSGIAGNGAPQASTAPSVPSAPTVPRQAAFSRQAALPAPAQPQPDLSMPASMLPYPGARQQDWGQTAARSPWMSLVKAGATMANSIGPIGSVIGKGVAAGAGELDTQRKSLQTEEGINQRAQSLYQQAKHHLDQYSKMTPYQRQSLGLAQQRLDREKYSPVNYETSDGKVIAASYDPKTGTYRDEEGAPLTGGKIIARQSGAESATSRGNAALRSAEKDPNYYGDQLGTINKWREKFGAPPLAQNEIGGATPAQATPDPGPDKRIKGMYYLIQGQPRQWRGTGGE